MYFNYNYNYTSAYNDGNDFSHGTPENARLHKRQMEEIANEIVSKAISDFANIELKKMMSEVAEQVYTQAINALMDGLSYDIKSCVTVGL